MNWRHGHGSCKPRSGAVVPRKCAGMSDDQARELARLKARLERVNRLIAKWRYLQIRAIVRQTLGERPESGHAQTIGGVAKTQ